LFVIKILAQKGLCRPTSVHHTGQVSRYLLCAAHPRLESWAGLAPLFIFSILSSLFSIIYFFFSYFKILRFLNIGNYKYKVFQI
jgi:hypothetical protein